jgi:hypothetical protein
MLGHLLLREGLVVESYLDQAGFVGTKAPGYEANPETVGDGRHHRLAAIH